MTYGKAAPASRHMRSHPYRREPLGSPRPDDEELSSGDLWKAVGTIKNYLVSSVSQFVVKLTGCKRPGKQESDRRIINGDALRSSPPTLLNADQPQVNGFLLRHELGNRNSGLRTERPFTNQHVNRPQSLPYRPLRSMTNVVPPPYGVKPYTYRRPWTSASKSASRRLNSNSINSMNISGSSLGRSPFNTLEPSNKPFGNTTTGQNYSPIYPRKLFSWERCRSKIEYKEEEGAQGENKVILTYTDPSIQRAIERADRSVGSQKDTSGSVTLKNSFASRLNTKNSVHDEQMSSKRKTFSNRAVEPGSKRSRSVKKNPEGMSKSTFNISEAKDIKSPLFSKSVTPSNQMEVNQKTETPDVKKVIDLVDNSAMEMSSSKNSDTIKPSKNFGPSSLFSNSSKPVSGGLFGVNESTSASDHKTSKQAKSTIFGQTQKKESITTEPANLFVKKLVKGKSIAEDKEVSNIPEAKGNSSSVTTAPIQKVSASEKATEVDENLSYACRMGRLRRIKIREYYIQKIENLYDSKCKDKEKDAKKKKAVSMYKNKYHKLREDHTFYTKLCKQYGVEPGEEYKGEDPDVQPEESEQSDGKVNSDSTSANKLFSDSTSSKELFAGSTNANKLFTSTSKPTVVTKPTTDKPHRNPFAQDSVTKPEKPAAVGFSFSGGNLFSNASNSTVKRKRPNESNPTNSFQAQCAPSVGKPGLFATKKVSTSAPSGAANPFSPAAQNSGSLFGSNTVSGKDNPFSSGVTKPTGLFGTSNGSTASMDSDVPATMGSGGFGATPNPFAVSTSKVANFGNSSSSNPFSRQQSSATGLFSSSSQGKPNPFTNVSSPAFGNTGAFNPGFGNGGTAKFSLGTLSGQSRKRRPVVRGRRTLK